MRLFCRKCDKEIREYYLSLLARNSSKDIFPRFHYKITVWHHGEQSEFHDLYDDVVFSSERFGDLYFFEEAPCYTLKMTCECGKEIEMSKRQKEQIDREYNRVVRENNELKNTERKAVKKTVDLHLKCMALEEYIERLKGLLNEELIMDKYGNPRVIPKWKGDNVGGLPKKCCEQWVAKTFRRYLELTNDKVPYIDDKFTFCPECGEKL